MYLKYVLDKNFTLNQKKNYSLLKDMYIFWISNDCKYFQLYILKNWKSVRKIENLWEKLKEQCNNKSFIFTSH